MSSNGIVPIDCAVCGFAFGSGLSGGTYFCSRCQQVVLAKARAGNLGAVVGALAVVLLAIGVGALIAKAVSD